MRTLALPREVEHRSLTTLREKLVKIGAKIVSHGRYVTFRMAEEGKQFQWRWGVGTVVVDLTVIWEMSG